MFCSGQQKNRLQFNVTFIVTVKLNFNQLKQQRELMAMDGIDDFRSIYDRAEMEPDVSIKIGLKNHPIMFTVFRL